MNIDSLLEDESFYRSPPIDELILLFQFHNQFDLCRSRIELLKALNPALRIYGLFGGAASDLDAARALTEAGLQSVFYDEARSPAWNKKNTDLAVLDWHRAVGRSEQFERVHVIQWDLLTFEPVDLVYPPLAANAVALTGLVPLSSVANDWHWTTFPSAAAESHLFLDTARKTWRVDQEPMVCIGPGYSLPRRFLDRYADIGVSDLAHDELRLPFFARVLGFELADTGFYSRWMDVEVERGFNADAVEIDPHFVEAELRRTGGRRVFHPCRERFDAATLDRLARRA